MSAAPAPRSRSSARGLRSAAALHRQGDEYRLVIVSLVSGATQITLAKSFSTRDTDGIAAELSSHKPDRVYRLIPGASTVCRVVDLPGGTDDELLAALSLQAEAQSPPGVAPHRRASGIVEGVSGARHGLIVAWPGENAEPAIRPAEETWVSEGVALAMLLGGRAQTFAAYADPDADSITIAATGQQRMAVRTVRETASGDEWSGAVAQTLRETLSRIGGTATPDLSISRSATLILEHTARRRLDQLVTITAEQVRADWINHYAMAAIVAVTGVTATPAQRALFELTPTLREARRSLIERGAIWISSPRRAVAVIVIGILAGLLVPLGYAAARQAILQGKLKKVEADSAAMAALQEVDKKVLVYEELNRKRWPMTRLLSNFSQLAPAGMDVEFLQLITGSRFVMKGPSDSLQLVASLQEALNKSQVFSGVTIDKTDSSSGRVKFDISGEVSRPHVEVKGGESYAEVSLAKRLYGDRAIEPGTAEAANGTAGSAGSRSSRSGSGGGAWPASWSGPGACA